MATGKRDKNYVPVWMGVSVVDFVTPLPVKVDSVTGRMLVIAVANLNETGAAPPTIGKRDPNRIVVRMGEVSGTNVPAPIKISSEYCVMLKAD
jgi:hypothetical protein